MRNTPPNPSGTTSAHAENTLGGGVEPAGYRNYLRARGEYVSLVRWFLRFWELPPRTRRILARRNRLHAACGTTSAHAENTLGGGVEPAGYRNYLRARGEYVSLVRWFLRFWELPPRTRRILARRNRLHAACGTTSAHAENTSASVSFSNCGWNYLRARGEYGCCAKF